MASPKGETSHEQDAQHLFRAIRRGKAHLTKFMLAASNNELLKCWNTEGRTPLIECCYIREEVTRSHMVRILKDAGADVNMKDKNGKTALIHACEQRCNDVVKILIQHANISPDIEDIDGNTALIHSAYTGNDVALELLVKSFRRLGLNVDHYNKAGYTALHVATANGFIQCAKVLAMKGKASLTLKDKVHQMTPLELCLKEGYQKGEVEFLKPSAKFYRVAKLTTTMVKYRKKSTQETSTTPPLASPVRTTEKPKSKVKSLLRKAKAHSKEEAEMGATSSPKPTESKSSEKNVMSKLLEKSKVTFFTRDSHKQALTKTPRQRSFSQSDQQDDAQSPAKVKSGLSHSHSHPLTSNCLEISVASSGTHGAESNVRNEHQGFITLAGEYGEWGTEDPDDDFLGIDSSFLHRHRSKASNLRDGGIFHGKKSTSGSGNLSSSNSKNEYGGVYCGVSSSAVDDTSTDSIAAECPHDTNVTQNTRRLNLCDEEIPHEEDTPLSHNRESPSPVFTGSGLEQSYLASDSNGDDSSCSSDDETELTLIGKGTLYKTELPSNVQLIKDLNPPKKANTSLHESVFSDFTDCRISNTDFAKTRSLKEAMNVDADCTLQNAENVSKHETSLTVNTTSDETKSPQMGRPTLCGEILIRSAQTERNTLCFATEDMKVNNYNSIDTSNTHEQSSHVSFLSQAELKNCRFEKLFEENQSAVQRADSYVTSKRVSDYLDNDTFQTTTFEDKTKCTHKVSCSQSECVHQTGSFGTSRTEESSQLTKTEFLEQPTTNAGLINQKNGDKSGQGFSESSADEIRKDFNASASSCSALKKSLDSCSHNAIRIVEQTSNQDFVVNSKIASEVHGDSEHSSCA